MKSILIMISALGGGGAERVAVRLANYLSGKYTVYILPYSRCDNPYPVIENVHILNYAVFDLRKKKIRPRQFLRNRISAFYIFSRLSWFRIRYKPDATLSLLLIPNSFNIFAPGKTRKILSERNNPKLKNKLKYQISKLVYRFGDAIVFQSQEVRSQYPQSVQKKGIIIPNPVEVDCQASEHPRHKIVTAGRLEKQKNHEMLIRAFIRFYPAHPEYELDIYGDGKLRDHLQKIIDEHGMSSHIHLIPNTRNIHEEMQDAEFYVLSSDYEGLPNSLLEAMMMGIPCISTLYPGVQEILEHKESAYLVPVGDVQELSDAMTEMAENADLRRKIAENGRQTAMNYIPEIVMPLWEKVLMGGGDDHA
ncbi:MAG: glycosyltransferase family 4 protein [Solobacterium sp.]|nr:glycosyltransferase family 4 protein [Solobacterium sp.]